MQLCASCVAEIMNCSQAFAIEGEEGWLSRPGRLADVIEQWATDDPDRRRIVDTRVPTGYFGRVRRLRAVTTVDGLPLCTACTATRAPSTPRPSYR